MLAPFVIALALGSRVLFGAPVQHLVIEGVRGAKIAPGASAQVLIEAKVREGFHVQANPASKPQLIATKVQIDSIPGIEVGRPKYPAGKPYRIEGLGMSISSYDGRFEIAVPLKVQASAKAGKFELQGWVRYQACDDKVCFPPTRVEFRAPVEVSSRS